MADSECPDGIRDALYDALTGSEAVGIAVCDRDFRYLAWNRFMERMTGLPAAAVLGRNALEIYPHLRDERLEPVLLRVLAGESVSLPDRRYHIPGVRSGWIGVQYVPHRAADGSVAGVVGLVHEVSERKRAEGEDERPAAFPREAPHPVLERDRDGSFVYANPAAGRLGTEPGAPEERTLPGTGHADLVRGAAVRGVKVPVAARVLRWPHHPQPSRGRVHLSGEDATRRAMEERPRREALRDPLTGLANRRLFLHRLAAAMDRGRSGREAFAVLFLDLDRFKVVNDSLGHPVGDQLLIAIAGRLRTCAREEDTVARFGGDEFAVLMESSSIDCALRAAEAIQRAMAEPVVLEGFEVFTSASIGIADGPGSAPDAEALMRGADAAMYRAKAAGPGGWAMYDQAMHTRALARLRLETELRRALDDGMITVHYQPIVHLASGRITGMEALARWRHPRRGWVPPAEFIACAEETGLILRLGRHVLDTACAQLGAWRAIPAAAELSVNVNVSVRQFAQAELAAQVESALDRGGVEPGRLRLEITESVLMDAAENAPAVLRRLRSLGVGVWMDDFGTGFSSLSTLHRLPMDGVKVDRSFLADDGEARGGPVLAAIAGLARGLGLGTVAEGVETPAQMDRVRALGCDYAQGYLISPALDADAMLALLAREPRW